MNALTVCTDFGESDYALCLKKKKNPAGFTCINTSNARVHAAK